MDAVPWRGLGLTNRHGSDMALRVSLLSKILQAIHTFYMT